MNFNLIDMSLITSLNLVVKYTPKVLRQNIVSRILVEHESQPFERDGWSASILLYQKHTSGIIPSHATRYTFYTFSFLFIAVVLFFSNPSIQRESSYQHLFFPQVGDDVVARFVAGREWRRVTYLRDLAVPYLTWLFQYIIPWYSSDHNHH